MEKSLELLRSHFPLTEAELRTYSGQAYAYVGDCIYDLVIRTMLFRKGNKSTNRYHQEAVRMVNAGYQAEMMHRIEPYLSEEEKTIYRRGRNAKTVSSPKNQSPHDYRVATGLEALMGYLYLSGRTERMLELMEIGLSDGKDS